MAPDKLILYASMYDNHRTIFTEALEDTGYSVLEANSGNSAKTELDRMRPHGVDLVITGSRDFKEIEALEQALDSLGEDVPPVIVFSAYENAQEGYKNTLLEKHIMEYVLKSSDAKPLVESVERIIGPP